MDGETPRRDMAALYTIMLGNPQLKAARDAEAKTRFKMWWRLVGSAVEHATDNKLDFQKLFIAQEEDDEDSASLADVLEVLVAAYPGEFMAKDVAELVNTSRISGNHEERSNKKLVRDYLLPGATDDHLFSAKSIGRLLRRHLDNAVKADDGCMLVLRKRAGREGKGAIFYHVDKTAGATRAGEPDQQEAAGVATTPKDHPGDQNTTEATPSGSRFFTTLGAPPQPGDETGTQLDRDVVELLSRPKG